MKTQKENPDGLHQRYYIQKIVPTSRADERANHDGESQYVKPLPQYKLVDIDKKAEYFVLRLDTGGSDREHIKACRKAVHAYADAIQHYLPQLAAELKETYPLLRKTRDELRKIWGDDLARAFEDYFDEDGWLTSDWTTILEDNFSDWDEDYNDTGIKKGLYQQMYMIEFKENEDGTKIICTEHWPYI